MKKWYNSWLHYTEYKLEVMKNYVQQQKKEQAKKFGFDQSLIELGLYIIPTPKKIKVAKC